MQDRFINYAILAAFVFLLGGQIAGMYSLGKRLDIQRTAITETSAWEAQTTTGTAMITDARNELRTVALYGEIMEAKCLIQERKFVPNRIENGIVRELAHCDASVTTTKP